MTIRFLSQDSYQLSVENDRLVGVAQPTVSVILSEVIRIINQFICPKYIKFPSKREIEAVATL